MTWPLAVQTFTAADRLRIGFWLLLNRQWTQGPLVRAYEQTWEKYTGARHAIMVANGSVANELLARRRRHELTEQGRWPQDNKVVFPVCTWVSSVSPWIQEGFVPVWCDISSNLCASQDAIISQIQSSHARTVFYTTLLGQTDDLVSLRAVCIRYGARLMVDNCESCFSRTPGGFGHKEQHVCAVAPSSTSFYFSHQATTGTEGGMIFCNEDNENDWFRMMRSHGMTRGMPAAYRNPDAHPSFDFCLAGSNARSSDLQAYMGALTFDRSLAFAARRIELGTLFFRLLDRRLYCDVTMGGPRNPLMALPILPSPTNRESGVNVKAVLDRLGIEYRPIVGGNLLRHTAFKQYGEAAKYPRAQHLHDNGVYVGLHHLTTEDMIRELAGELNK